jgi:uncharacterized protein YbjT (DUF2867 family)
MQARGKIAVAGATGRAGRHLVDILEEQGHRVVPIARSVGVDLVTGKGLADALEGVEVVVDVASGPSPEEQPATEFFTTAARNLQQFGKEAGVQRILAVSIIGIDGSRAGYGIAKQAHERITLAGPIPARILRASQFHELVPQLMSWGRENGTVFIPKMRTQLVAARTVAEALADIATAPDWPATPGSASASIPEIAGPREESLAEMAALFAACQGDPAEIEEVSNPDDPDRSLYENGGLLPGPHATLAGPTFEEWLRREIP